MKFNELKQDTYIKNWLSGIGAKTSTREIYTDSMRAYTDFLEKTPQQLIEESEEEILSGLLMRKRRIVSDLREFREYLENSDAAPMSIKGRMTAVRSFYRYYDIQLPFLPKSTTKARPPFKHRDIPTKDDIREIISIADPLEKAIVLTGVSSGLAVNEISNLKVQEFLDGYDPETEITTLHLVRQKVGYEFYTFLSPEASRAIIEYLELRNRTSEINDKQRQEHLLKQKVEYDKNGKVIGYLFIGRYIPSEYLTAKKNAEELRKLETKAIQKIYRELSERSRKASPSGEWNLVRSHNIRKFFNSTLLANHAELFFTDFLMGHQIDSTRDAYYRADPKALRDEYQKYVPYLTIQKELNISESPEFIKLKNENEVLARETAKATVERAEIQRINIEFEEYKIDTQIQMLETRKDSRMQSLEMMIDMLPEKTDELQEQIENTKAYYDSFIENVKTKLYTRKICMCGRQIAANCVACHSVRVRLSAGWDPPFRNALPSREKFISSF
ncbi:tyrosine-type recombinase/integrase [Methanosarcina sp. T3]|uniref:tyrosine-type recombinase/integrase n=1 Tax=Methanosarcina sp. T3 TaxID=3439062 RepID=UPI003F836876